MRMLKPSPGEAADRQGILQLKMEHADTGEQRTAQSGDKVVEEEGVRWGVNKTLMSGVPKIDISPFHWEHEALQQYLEQNWFINFPQNAEIWDVLFDKLKEVNTKLWNLEDEARALRGATKNNATVYRAATCLFEITQFNDDRAALVREINKAFDLDVVEKMYAAS